MNLFPQPKQRLDHTANKLSRGEQQMLAVVRALMGNPDLLLLDEPTEGLAPVRVRELPSGPAPPVNDRVRVTAAQSLDRSSPR